MLSPPLPTPFFLQARTKFGFYTCRTKELPEMGNRKT
jgi:hypothetical protein